MINLVMTNIAQFRTSGILMLPLAVYQHFRLNTSKLPLRFFRGGSDFCLHLMGYTLLIVREVPCKFELEETVIATLFLSRGPGIATQVKEDGGMSAYRSITYA